MFIFSASANVTMKDEIIQCAGMSPLGALGRWFDGIGMRYTVPSLFMQI